MHALSDPVRLQMVRALADCEEPIACGTIDVPVAKSTRTHHWRVLRENGLIRQTERGTAKLTELRRDDLEARFPGLLKIVLEAAPAPAANRLYTEFVTLDPREGPRDECGVFGIYAPGHDVSRLAYFALYALQHRGQESAGIAAADVGGHIMTQRELGLVYQVFDEQTCARSTGDIAVGSRALLHDRAPTRGRTPSRCSARGPPRDRAGPQRQPHQRRRAAQRAARAGRHVLSTSDSEIIAALIATHPAERVEDAIADVIPRLRRRLLDVVLTADSGDRASATPTACGRCRSACSSAPARRPVATAWPRVVRLRHHRRDASCATSSRGRWSGSTSAACRRAAWSRASARPSASSSTSTSRGPTRAWAARCCRCAREDGRDPVAARRRWTPTWSSPCPTRATPPRAAWRAPPGCPRTTASSRTATSRARSSSPARSCESTACG